MIYAFVVVSNIFDKNKYNVNNVSKDIEQNWPDFKYYGNYARKTPDSNIIFRYYKVNDKKKITLSVLPAYILTRKQKSIK